MDVSPILRQIDSVLQDYEKLRINTVLPTPNTEEYNKVYSRVSSTIESLVKPDSAYYFDYARIRKSVAELSKKVPQLIGIIQAIRADYDEGYLRTIV